jgi:hypothetical protein
VFFSHALAVAVCVASRGWQDKAQKFLEGVVLTLFGYAQNAREEYLLLQLIKVRIPSPRPTRP